MAASLATLREELSGNEKKWGKEHPETMTSLYHLANLHRTQGKVELAAHLYQQCLAGRKKVLGPDHPRTR